MLYTIRVRSLLGIYSFNRTYSYAAENRKMIVIDHCFLFRIFSFFVSTIMFPSVVHYVDEHVRSETSLYTSIIRIEGFTEHK